MTILNILPALASAVGTCTSVILLFVQLKTSHKDRMTELDYAHMLKKGDSSPEAEIKILGPDGIPLVTQDIPEQDKDSKPNTKSISWIVAGLLAVTLILGATTVLLSISLIARSDKALAKITSSLGLFENRCLPGRLEGPGDLTGFPGDLSSWTNEVLPSNDPVTVATVKLAQKDLNGTISYIDQLEHIKSAERFNLLMIKGRAYVYSSNLEKAKSCFESANSIEPNNATCLNHLVNILLLTDNGENSLKYAIDASSVSKSLYGADSLDYVKSLSNLGSARLVSKDINQAEKDFNECTNILNSIHPRPSLAIAHILHNQAWLDLKCTPPRSVDAVSKLTNCIAAYVRAKELDGAGYLNAITLKALALTMIETKTKADSYVESLRLLKDNEEHFEAQRNNNLRLYANTYANWAAYAYLQRAPDYGLAIDKSTKAIDALAEYHLPSDIRAGALNIKGLALIGARRLSSAHLELESAVAERLKVDNDDLTPTVCKYMLDDAGALIADGNKAKARRIIQVVLSHVQPIAPKSPTVNRAKKMMEMTARM